jgi:glycine cleavage system aminomethyltransferase T
VRITYLGELGYELYIPTEQAVHVYDRLVAAGEPLGLRHAGLKALASLPPGEGVPRLRPRHRQHRHVLEAGLGFAVDLKAAGPLRKPGGFIGKRRRAGAEGEGAAVTAAPRAGAGVIAGARYPIPTRCSSTPRSCSGATASAQSATSARASYGHTLGLAPWASP